MYVYIYIYIYIRMFPTKLYTGADSLGCPLLRGMVSPSNKDLGQGWTDR